VPSFEKCLSTTSAHFKIGSFWGFFVVAVAVDELFELFGYPFSVFMGILPF
jgi:hypothetical protein